MAPKLPRFPDPKDVVVYSGPALFRPVPAFKLKPGNMLTNSRVFRPVVERRLMSAAVIRVLCSGELRLTPAISAVTTTSCATLPTVSLIYARPAIGA